MAAQENALSRVPRGIRIGLIVGWAIIIVKCIAAPSIIARWNVPIAPGWIIIPTLIFAVVVTALALTHDWSRGRE